jgi:hypothetical protein
VCCIQVHAKLVQHPKQLVGLHLVERAIQVLAHLQVMASMRSVSAPGWIGQTILLYEQQARS